MASRSQFELNDDNNFETLNFRFENSAFDIPDGLLGSAYYNSISNSLKVKTNLGWEDYLTLTSLNALNASNLTSGTVPLARLSGITTTQLSATAGILSSQIAGLDASKITGTFPLSLLSQGTTDQFLRGDGTFSNSLTGGLTIAGALAGATTGSFSGTLTLSTACNLDFGANGTSSGTQNSITGQSSGLRINAKSGSSLQFVVGGVSKVSILSTELSMGPIPINYGAAGTTTAANSEIVGAVGGLRYNVASGLGHTLLVANTAALTLNSTSATFSGTLAATAATITTGSIQFLANNGGLFGSGSSNQMRIGSGSTGISSSGASIALNGNTTTTLQGYLWLYAGQVAGGRIRAIDETNTQQMEISSAGTTINKIILIDNTPATATSTGTEGQIAWDASGNLYLCPVANTWLKFTGATF